MHDTGSRSLYFGNLPICDKSGTDEVRDTNHCIVSESQTRTKPLPDMNVSVSTFNLWPRCQGRLSRRGFQLCLKETFHLAFRSSLPLAQSNSLEFPAASSPNMCLNTLLSGNSNHATSVHPHRASPQNLAILTFIINYSSLRICRGKVGSHEFRSRHH